MARIEIDGLIDLQQSFDELAARSMEMASMAVYAGAEVTADTIREAVETLPIDERRGSGGKKSQGIRQVQKDGLLERLGISRMEHEPDITHVSISFSGYNERRTKKHPKGEPNILIARMLEKGTSHSIKIPFFRQAVSRAEPEAQKAMDAAVHEFTEKIMGK